MRRVIVLTGAALLGITGCASSAALASHEPWPPGPFRSLAAAAPALSLPAGPGPGLRQRACTPKTVVASASLRPAVDGVLGVLTIGGTKCSPSVDVTRIRLLGADGSVLAIPAGTPDGINPAESIRPDLAEDAGSVRVGFAWTGSYCGPPATSVEIPALPAMLRIPLSGASPPCQKVSNSRLIPGVEDSPGAPVEPAPHAWHTLRARLVLPAVVRPGPIFASVVLTNSAAQPVSLVSPCPTYAVDVLIPQVAIPTAPAHNYDGDVQETGGAAGDLCSAGISVPARGSVTLKLRPLATPPEDSTSAWRKGGQLSLEWAMAGVPTAQATALIG
jgi:hypothetical protein